MPKYILHWLGGNTQEVEGDSIASACNNAGIGAGAIKALDYYEEVKEEKNNDKPNQKVENVNTHTKKRG